MNKIWARDTQPKIMKYFNTQEGLTLSHFKQGLIEETMSNKNY
jgi:hypothetical protein